ncbi:MAG TPA: RNB domain-containing ribonuclease [Mycobacteriales bacterium]|nr:RNB domain-containing ribonuclease [Mycobacteriales bacterium]
MPPRPTFIRGADLAAPLRALRAELKVPDGFAPEVLAAADAARDAWSHADRLDATDLPLVTLDPAGSQDLDQAFAIAPLGAGYRFHYAIANVAAFVPPDGPLAATARDRGETLYLPDGRAPVYPLSLSEGAASLLPDGERPAVLWRLDLDATGEPTEIDVRRAVVRSRAQLNYDTFGDADPSLVEGLRRVGELRLERERERGGVSLNVPEQLVVRDGDGWSLEYRETAPAEGWNAQLSLLVGMAAARLMVHAKVGLLRTMPAPWHRRVEALHRSAVALGVARPPGTAYAEIIRSLDPARPNEAAMLRLAASLFRGAGYVAFDGTLPGQIRHAAVAAPYAHATAPLRRLGDRFVSELCLAISAKRPVPEWARQGLPALPHLMAVADQRAHAVDHAVIDLAETVLLQDRVGEVFDAVVVEAEDDHGEIQVINPPVKTKIAGTDLPLGHEIRARLEHADVTTRKLTFSIEVGSHPDGRVFRL